MPADHIAHVLLQFRPMLRSEPVLSGARHPVLVAITHQVRELAETGIEQDGHHADLMPAAQAQEALESFQKQFRIPLVNRELQEHADGVQL